MPFVYEATFHEPQIVPVKSSPRKPGKNCSGRKPQNISGFQSPDLRGRAFFGEALHQMLFNPWKLIWCSTRILKKMKYKYDRYDLISKPFFICISIIFLYDSKYLIRYEPFFIWCSRKLPSKCFVEFVESDLILENGYVQNGFHILDFRRLNTWVSSW